MNPDYIRTEIAKEQIIELDFEYISEKAFKVFETVKQLPIHVVKLRVSHLDR